MRNRSVLVLLVFSILVGLSPLSADPTIRRGIDVFQTPADGNTYYDFSTTPVPAGFFCKGSKAFTGRVAFKGLPLATGTPGQLGRTDTIIERLDDAVFDAQGVAVTRIQFRALSLVSIAPIKTACGSFHAYLSLGGDQRVTTMKIQRTQDGGGTFAAPLAINARMAFVPVKSMKSKTARKLELTGIVNFPGRPLPWSFRDGEGMKSLNSVVVDTNGDLTPDTKLPGTSNFWPGMPPGVITGAYGDIGACPCPQPCHDNGDEMHCYYPSDCYPVVCME